MEVRSVFQGMTIGEQRTLLALVGIITAGLAYQAYREHRSRQDVYVEHGPRTAVAMQTANNLAPAPMTFTPAVAASPSPAPQPVGIPPPASQAAAHPYISAAAPAPTPSSAPTGKIDLNTATAADLDTLPSIGPKRAQAILDYRAKIVRFHSVDQLVDVPGIGPKTLENVRSGVCVSP